MIAAPRLRVLAVDLFERPFALRMPFRFGLHTLTHARQALLRVTVQLEGGAIATGWSAEVLLAKWFDKRPGLTPEDNENQLRQALRNAAHAYMAAGRQTAFELFANTYGALMQAGAAVDLPPLAVGFGPALLDRAVLDALCRHHGIGFWEAMRANLPGMKAHAVIAGCEGLDFDAFLASLTPLRTLHARHTVGMLDPLQAGSEPADAPRDGLPVTLADCIATYGNTHFKLKLSGDKAWDLDRLTQIAAVLDAAVPAGGVVTLDGNEQYADAAQLLDLCHAIAAAPALARLLAGTLFIEQPIARANALAVPVGAVAAIKPVILDESDGTLDAFVQARAQGYQGVSTKSCKGLYKSIINSARCMLWNREAGKPAYFMSAEDLIIQPGISLQQDLALASLLGIGHIERNGHHYVNRFAATPAQEAQALAAAHGDLYACAPQPALRIGKGILRMASCGEGPGFGTAVLPVVSGEPAAAWHA